MASVAFSDSSCGEHFKLFWPWSLNDVVESWLKILIDLDLLGKILLAVWSLGSFNIMADH